MAKRKTENKEEEKIDNSIKETSKKVVKKTSAKKEMPKKTIKKEVVVKKEKKEDKKTLLQLIDESNVRDSFIIGALSFNNMLNVLEEEKYNVEKGLFVKPVMTDSEFNKIIKDFLNRRI